MFDDTRWNQKMDSRVEVAVKASEPRTGDRLSLNVLGSNRADCIARGDQIATEFFDGMPYRRHILGTDYMGAASKFRMSLTYVVVEN